MMNFLSGILRDEGGFEYKKAIVDTIINIIEDSPDGKEAGKISKIKTYIFKRIL